MSHTALQILIVAVIPPLLLAAGYLVRQRRRRSARMSADSALRAAVAASQERRQRRAERQAGEASFQGHGRHICLAAMVLYGVFASTWLADAQARDLGPRGPLYEISEPDLLKEMLDVMRAKQASGELQRLQDVAKRKAVARVETPPAVPGLRRTAKARTFLFDPSVRFDEPVVDDQGRIVIPAGTVGNPLQTVRMSRELLFFDGRDPDQVKLAKARLDELGPRLKLILVAGQPLALTRQWKVQVFFDQDGQLVQRFGIRQVPARVSQDGLRLMVEEMAP